jgi:hypothetical protein
MDLNGYQVGAIIFNILFMILIPLSFTVFNVLYIIQLCILNFTENKNVSFFPKLLYRFWVFYKFFLKKKVIGIDLIEIEDEYIIIRNSSLFFGLFYSPKTIIFKDEIQTISIERDSLTLCNALTQIFFSIFWGCIFGLFFHFIPCFGIWSCDGSINDRIDIRGLIWGASWVIIMASLWLLMCLPWVNFIN